MVLHLSLETDDFETDDFWNWRKILRKSKSKIQWIFEIIWNNSKQISYNYHVKVHEKAKCWILGSFFEIFEFWLLLTFSACNVSSPKIKVFYLFSYILQFLGVKKITLQCKKVQFSTVCEYCAKFPWNWRFLKLTRVWPPDLSSVSKNRCNGHSRATNFNL